MITEATMQVLKNFATINPNIVIEEGNMIQTISEAKNVVSKSIVDVEFPKTFGIFDLNEFLAVLNLIDKPELKFTDNYVTVCDSVGRTNIKYYYSDLDVLTRPTSKVIAPEGDVKFTLDRETLSKVRRAAGVLGHNEVSVSCIDNTVCLTVSDKSDSTSNAYSIAVDGTYNEEQFNFVFNINNLKMIEGDYDVSISQKLISHFVNRSSKIEYWVALEKTSTYGE
tara:strand:+ start:2649 stop:3320 length:672 start_codon:yes stop_codon:yes gene_type:complete